MALGLRRARYHPLGRAAVRNNWALILLAPFLLAGCRTVSAITAAAAGASTGTVTADPLIGYATTIGVNAGLDALEDYIARVRDNAEQDQIVKAVGEMNVGDQRPWKIVHTIPMFDNEHGQMQVTRLIETPLTDCKEVLFTVESGNPKNPTRTLYTTSACHDTQGWKWAAAEPATDRWGYLQRRRY